MGNNTQSQECNILVYYKKIAVLRLYPREAYLRGPLREGATVEPDQRLLCKAKLLYCLKNTPTQDWPAKNTA